MRQGPNKSLESFRDDIWKMFLDVVAFTLLPSTNLQSADGRGSEVNFFNALQMRGLKNGRVIVIS